MNPQTLWVPFSSLNAPTHSAGTRLVWLLLALLQREKVSPPTDRRLSELSGLTVKWVVQARASLDQAPLGRCYARPYPSCAAIPAALLTETNISAGARLLYGQLQSVRGFTDSTCTSTFAALAQLTGASDEALRRAAAELTEAGWLTALQPNRKQPIQFTLYNPAVLRTGARIRTVRRKTKRALYRGEALLREYLTAMIDLDRYEDDAAPDFLLNPFTDELMELDRFYPTAQVAFEFQGDQHSKATDLATFGQTVKQVGRDAMKAFICKSRGIELVLIHPEELCSTAIDQKIPESLPRRERCRWEPLVTALDRVAAEYRERTADERARKRMRSSK